MFVVAEFLHCAAHLAKKRRKRWIPRNGLPQDANIDEVSECSIPVVAGPSEPRNEQRDLIKPSVSLKKQKIDAQKNRRRRHTVSLRHLPQCRRNAVINREGMARTSAHWLPLHWPVGRHFQDRQDSRQPALPVSPQTMSLVVIKHPMLPSNEIVIGFARRSEFCRPFFRFA